MKKALYTFIFVIVLLFAAAPSILGFSLVNLGHAINVSTALTAKLGCSSYFVSGFSKKQTVEDLSSYSPVAQMVTMDYQDVTKKVTSDLFGMAKTSATYREGIGCTLDSENSHKLDSIKIKRSNHKQVVFESTGMTNSALDYIENIDDSVLEEWPLGSFTNYEAPLIQDSLNSMIRADNEKGYNTRALLVVKQGHILGEAYGPNVNKHTPLLGWSMGKSIIAIMLGHLEFSGVIDKSSESLFTQWQNDERSKLTLEHLLQMSSGLQFDETYAPGSDATHMLFTASSASDVAINKPLINPAGSTFSYSSGTTNLLSRFIYEALNSDTQKTYDFLFQRIFKPLGMANSIFEVDASGVIVGSSYIYASGQDWAKLGLLMLNNGEINGYRLLSKDWVKRATAPNKSNNDKRYGYQFWLNSGEKELRWPTLPDDAYAMLGNRKQSVMIIPSQDVVLVRLGWTTNDYPMEKNYHQLLQLLQ